VTPEVTGWLDRLGVLAGELASDHRELAQLLTSEKQAKLEGWQNASSDRDAAKLGEIQGFPVTEEIFKLKGEMAARIEERDYLRLMVDIHTRSTGAAD
jgi:hypothetical protein